MEFDRDFYLSRQVSTRFAGILGPPETPVITNMAPTQPPQRRWDLQTAACPICHAPPQSPCLTKHGQESPRPHETRWAKSGYRFTPTMPLIPVALTVDGKVDKIRWQWLNAKPRTLRDLQHTPELWSDSPKTCAMADIHRGVIQPPQKR